MIKFKHMPENKGKKKGKPIEIFHYFTLNTVTNSDNSVTCSWALTTPLPEGNIVKYLSLHVHDAASGAYIGQPWSVGPNQSADVNYGTGFTTIPQVPVGVAAPDVIFRLVGSYGVPDVKISAVPLGSNDVLVSYF